MVIAYYKGFKEFMLSRKPIPEVCGPLPRSTASLGEIALLTSFVSEAMLGCASNSRVMRLQSVWMARTE